MKCAWCTKGSEGVSFLVGVGRDDFVAFHQNDFDFRKRPIASLLAGSTTFESDAATHLHNMGHAVAFFGAFHVSTVFLYLFIGFVHKGENRRFVIENTMRGF